MQLGKKDYKLIMNTVHSSLRIDLDGVERSIKDSLKVFIGDMDISDYDVRHKVFLYLQHLSAVFLNYCLHSNEYLLSEKEIKNSRKSMDVIRDIIKEWSVEVL